MTFHRLQQFFWICSGTPLAIIEKYPTEHSKYFGIGATIFFTALFAGLSGGYALYFVFSGSTFAWLWSLLFGFVWGLAIFNLDRYIVSSIKKSSRASKQFMQASPRLLFAVLIAIVIVRPLELKIFDKEIREKLRSRYIGEQQQRIVKLQGSFKEKYAQELGQIALFQKEYEKLSDEISRLREELKAEVFGTRTGTTSGMQGYGVYARNKEQVIASLQSRLDFLAARLNEKQEYMNRQKELEGLNTQSMLTDGLMAEKVANAGFADRNWALGALTHDSGDVSSSSATAVRFITMLFIVFECAPLIVKLLSDAGPSDIDIRENEARIFSFLTDTSFLSRNRLIREYRRPGQKTKGKRAPRNFQPNRRTCGRNS